MNIAVFSTFPDPQSGFTEYNINLMTELRKFGHNVSPYQITNNSEHNSSDEKVTNFTKQGDLAILYNSSSLEQYDLLIINYDRAFFVGDNLYLSYYNFFLFLSSLPQPLVLICHSKFGQTDKFYVHLLSKLLKLKHIFWIVHNQDFYDQLKSITSESQKRVFLLPHGCDRLRDLNREETKQLGELEKKYGSKKIILTLGFIAAWKNQLFLIKMFYLISKHYPNAVFLIYGSSVFDSEYFKKCQAAVKYLGLTDKVVLRDEYISLSMYRVLLKFADVYVAAHESIDHPTSGTLSYAICAGKAVVSKPISFAYSHGINTSVLFASSEREFAIRTILLLRNKSLRTSYEKKALKLSSEWGWDKVAKKIENICLNARKIETQEKKTLVLFRSPRPISKFKTTQIQMKSNFESDTIIYVQPISSKNIALLNIQRALSLFVFSSLKFFRKFLY